MVPWKNGKLLVWDATYLDTFVPSYISSATSEAGAVAALAEERKKNICDLPRDFGTSRSIQCFE